MLLINNLMLSLGFCATGALYWDSPNGIVAIVGEGLVTGWMPFMLSS